MKKCWEDLKVGDIIYIMTPIEQNKESEILECNIINFSKNTNINQFVIDIHSNYNYDYRIYIKVSDNNKLCIFTHLSNKISSFNVLISLNKKELIKCYIDNVKNLCNETHEIYNQAFISWQSMESRLKHWEKIYKMIDEK